MLACFCSDKRMMDEVKEEQMDKVELAFRKFDLDGDGFLSWEEFQQVRWDAFQLCSTEQSSTSMYIVLWCVPVGYAILGGCKPN